MSEGVPSLELRCLGAPTALVDGRDPPAEVLWRKHLGLLTYLALSPDGTRTRDHVIGLFWADRPGQHARRSLNEAVRLLRAALGNGRLITNGPTLRLSPQELTVDAREFESLCAAGQLRALDLVRGELLEGFHLDDAPAFDSWVESQRTRIRDAATQLLIARATDQLAVNRYLEARELTRRALTLDPLCEPAVTLGMRSAALEGDAAGALALFHTFAQRMQSDIGEQPGATLSELAARIREGKWQRRRGPREETQPPLIGRREVHGALFARVDDLRCEGRVCLVISGDMGSGRTRLLEACAERLALAGATVATARILESDHDAPWSTLRSLMRGGLLDAPGLLAMDHLGLRVLAGIVPELAGRVAPIEAPDVAQVSDAMASLLRAVTDERPTAMLIDDAQWADGPTLAAMRAVWAREDLAAAMLGLTLDTGVAPTRELQRLVGSVEREIPGAHARLEPFTADEIAALTEAMAPWCGVKQDRDRLTRRVSHESGGNPLLAVTLLQELAHLAGEGAAPPEWPPPGSTFDATMPITIPTLVRNAILTRVARLDADSLAVLRAASVAGEVLDPALVAQASGIPTGRVEAALDRLERERFVTFDGTRYAFNGRLLPAVIERECTQPGGRRRVRERYIEALAPRDDLQAQLLHARLLSLEHRPGAFEAAVRVADGALVLGAERAAAGAIHAAERVSGKDPEKRAAVAELRRRLGGANS